MPKKKVLGRKPTEVPTYWEQQKKDSEVKAARVYKAIIRKCEDKPELTLAHIRACFGLCEVRKRHHKPLGQEFELKIALALADGSTDKTKLVAAVYECPLGSELWKMCIHALSDYIEEEHGAIT